jgi:molecular chaperone GrpE
MTQEPENTEQEEHMEPEHKEPEQVVENKEQEYLEGWKRARADLENLQKRMVDSRLREHAAIKRSVAESLIALSDNFRSLTEHAPDTKDPWVAGVLHVARQFEQTLQELGVETVSDIGGEFNPAIHEAVEEVKGEGKPGTVVELVQAGYKIGDIVIRPAKVKISS